MHNPLIVHLAQPTEESKHEFLDFFLREAAIAFLYTMEELSSSKDFQNHINGILGLEYSFKEKKVVMSFTAEFTHDGEFVD